MGDSLKDVRHELASLVGDLPLLSVAAAGSTTTLRDDSGLVEPDDDWEGAYIKIYAGPGLGQERVVASFASHTLTVATAWGTPPASGSYYEMHRTWRAADYDRFIKMAYRARRKRILLPMTYGSLVMIADQYEYDAPTGMVALNEVWKEDDDDDFSHIIPMRDLRVDRAAKKLIFDKTAANYAGYIEGSRRLRLVGQKYDTIPTDDDDEFAINTTPLLWLAKASLHASEGNDASMKAALAMSQVDAEDDDTPLWPGSLIIEEV